MLLNEPTREFTCESAQLAFDQEFQSQNLPLFGYEGIDYNLQGLFLVPQRSAYLTVQAYCRAIDRSELTKQCVIDYVELDAIQAYAISEGDYNFIAISHSIPVVLQVLFQYVVGKTNPFTRLYRDASLDTTFPLDLANPQVDLPSIEPLILSTLPPERWQKVMSARLTELATLFCICHEVAHVFCGHADLTKKRGIHGLAEIEMQESQGRSVSHRMSQAWELQADRTALALMFGYVLNNESFKKKLTKQLKCYAREGIEEQLLNRPLTIHRHWSGERSPPVSLRSCMSASTQKETAMPFYQCSKTR